MSTLQIWKKHVTKTNHIYFFFNKVYNVHEHKLDVNFTYSMKLLEHEYRLFVQRNPLTNSRGKTLFMQLLYTLWPLQIQERVYNTSITVQ